MNYYIHSLFSLIAQQAKATPIADGSRLQIMVPHLSAIDARDLLHRLANFAHEHHWRLIFKVADESQQDWDAGIIADFKQKDCFANGNLTQYRNQILPDDPATLLVFVGVDLVMDKGGLADFYRCDGEALWVESMRKSFADWIQLFFGQHGIAEFSDSECRFFDDILSSLRIKSDIPTISRILGQSDFKGPYTSARELICDVLSRLSVFHLPNLSGFNERLARRGFLYYIEAATSFFNYEDFIEFSKRDKALKAVEAFGALDHDDDVKNVYFPSHGSLNEFLNSLKHYIGTNDRASRERLVACDFVYINDRILKAKPKKEAGQPKKTLHKLDGAPVEVVLRAVWQTFEKYPRTDIRKIVLMGKKFQHDCPMDDMAEAELKQLLGGLDALCNSHIQLTLDADSPNEFVPVASHLLNDDLIKKSAKTAEPFFEFTVGVENAEDTFEQRFALKLPETHPYRLAVKLFGCAKNMLNEDCSFTAPCSLPVFHLEYYKEFMMAREREELCRVLLHCLNACDQNTRFAENIFTSAWSEHDRSAAMKPFLQKVSVAYKAFINRADDAGLYAALDLGHTPDIFIHYNAAATAFTKNVKEAKDSHQLAALLMRSFLFIEKKPRKDIDMWSVSRYEQSGVVTVLHPALLEMLQSQITFLFAAFSNAASSEFQKRGAVKFKKSRWSYYVDMAEMKMPLTGLSVDTNNTFKVCSNGQGIIHRIGEITPDQALATTRFLIRYDRVDDEEVADAELFRESSESRHLFRMLKEYNKMHVSADDGISIAVYRNDDIQPVLAALNQYIQWLNKEVFKDVPHRDKYAVKVMFFSEVSDTSVISNWLTQWQNFLDDAEDGNGEYGDCRFTVSHRIVKTGDGYRQFADTIRQEIDADIFIFYNFIKPGSNGCVFRPADEFNATQDSLKFPVLEKAQCSSTLPDERLHREQIVSNRQFKISTNHAEIVARLRDTNVPQGQHHIVLATGDFAPWQTVIDSAHISAEWVVCIDACIDEALIGSKTDDDQPKRELIGYGSGVGLHGECNYTISTQKFFMDDIRRILLNSMRTVYNYGNIDHDRIITDQLLRESKALAGISLIRALGPGEYVRDFMAYCLMHRILPLAEQAYLCDKIFSIDAYHHWFDQASEEDKTHPDLLWVRTSITNKGQIHIDAKVIECKMANMNAEHLEKARKQIVNGLKILVDVFTPNQGGLTAMRRPDQRYWYLQLHRLIASCARLPNTTSEAVFLQAMERLATGDYEISWGAGVFAFWTNSLDAELRCNERFPVVVAEQTINVPIFTAGYDFVYLICASEGIQHLDWGEEVLQIPRISGEAETCKRPPEECPMEIEETDDYMSPVPSTHMTSPDPVSEVVIQPSTPVDAMSVPEVSSREASAATATTSTISGVPQRVLLGRTVNGSKDVYWEFGHPKLNNRHFLIFGNSGMGKTYAIQAMLCELGKQQQNSLIVDYTNGFLNNQLQDMTKEILNPIQYVVKTKKLPINPFAKQSQDIGDGEIISDTSIDIAKRVTSIFDTVYHLGQQQESLLIDAIQKGLDENPMFSLDDLLNVLESFIDDDIHPKASVQNTISKIKPFISGKPFANTTETLGWQELFANKDKHCHVFQMTMMDRLSYLILTEFILWDLYSFVRSSGSEKNPRVVVLDEVQNLDQRLDAPLGKFLTEGRKFGISLIAATQTLSNLKTDEQARLFQAAHKLFFKPADSEIAQYADLVRNAAQSRDVNEWKQRLTSLDKGECLSIGPALDERTGQLRSSVEKIHITSLEERGF